MVVLTVVEAGLRYVAVNWEQARDLEGVVQGRFDWTSL